MSGVEVHTCDPCTEEADAGFLQELKPCQKTEAGEGSVIRSSHIAFLEDPISIPGIHFGYPYSYAHTYIQTHS